MKRRPCRAVACPRKVERDVIFCPVHLPQLTPQVAAKLNGNRELPTTALPVAQRELAGAVGRAVAVLAKKEGRAETLRKAVNSQSIDPADQVAGSTSDGAATRTGGGYRLPNVREL